MPRRLRALLPAAVLGATWLLLTAAPASAHASLLSANPADGTSVIGPPDQATIVFDEPVEAEAGDLRLFDAEGERVPGTRLSVTDGGRALRLVLPELQRGGYVVAWGVLSTDGHPITGAVAWQVGAGSSPVEPAVVAEVLAGERASATVDRASAVARWFQFAGTLVVLGGLLAVARTATVGPDVAVRRLLWAAWTAALVGSIVGLALFGADLAGGGLGDAVDASLLGDALDTDAGLLALGRVVLLALGSLLLVRLRPTSAVWAAAAGAGGAAVLVTFTLAGHPRAGRWQVAAAAIDVVHLAAASAWLGGLAVLAVQLVGRPSARRLPHLWDAARRFSGLAVPAIAVVVLTGSAQSLRQVERLAEIRETDFGRLLLAKVIAVAVLVALAALSRSVLRAPPGPTTAPATEDLARLRQSVGAEVLVVVAVLGLTAVLVAADPTPPRQPSGFQATTVVDGVAIEAIVAPARVGPVDVHVYVEAPGAGLTGARDASGTLTPTAGGSPIPLRLVPTDRNHFSVIAVELPRPGRWRLRVDLVLGDLGSRVATFDVDVE